MDLKVYLVANRIKQKDFAATLGIDKAYMSLIVNGHLLPGKRLLRDIETLTQGKVKLKAQADVSSDQKNDEK